MPIQQQQRKHQLNSHCLLAEIQHKLKVFVEKETFLTYFERDLQKVLLRALKVTKKEFAKELSLCHKLRFSNNYIFATQCRRP